MYPVKKVFFSTCGQNFKRNSSGQQDDGAVFTVSQDVGGCVDNEKHPHGRDLNPML